MDWKRNAQGTNDSRSEVGKLVNEPSFFQDSILVTYVVSLSVSRRDRRGKRGGPDTDAGKEWSFFLVVILHSSHNPLSIILSYGQLFILHSISLLSLTASTLVFHLLIKERSGMVRLNK